MEEGGPVPTPTHVNTDPSLLESHSSLEAVEEEESTDTKTTKNESSVDKEKEKVTPPKHSEPLIPSINIELNVTINVDSGSIVLHSEDLV